MSHIFQENVQIPIPYGTYVNPTTQQVFIKFRPVRSTAIALVSLDIWLNVAPSDLLHGHLLP